MCSRLTASVRKTWWNDAYPGLTLENWLFSRRQTLRPERCSNADTVPSSVGHRVFDTLPYLISLNVVREENSYMVEIGKIIYLPGHLF